MAVRQMPPNIPMVHFRRVRKLKVNMRRAMNCTIVPNTNATATERKMPSITDRAFSVFRSWSNPSPMPPAILMSATTNVAPSSSKTIETVVEVGIPSELNMSSRMMSVTITAMKMHIRS